MRRLALLVLMLNGCVNPDCDKNRWQVSLDGRGSADGVGLCLQGWAQGGSTQERINVGSPEVSLAVHRLSLDPPDETLCWTTGPCGTLTITFSEAIDGVGPVAATCAMDLTCLDGLASTADWSCAITVEITDYEDPPTAWPGYAEPPATDRRYVATFAATLSAPDTQAMVTTDGSFEMLDVVYYDPEPDRCERGGGGGGGWDD